MCFRLRNCCCCLPLREGSIAVAILQILLGASYVVYGLVVFSKQQGSLCFDTFYLRGQQGNATCLQLGNVAAMGVEVVLGLVLLVGVLASKLILIRVYLAGSLLQALMAIVASAALASNVVDDQYNTAFISLTIAFALISVGVIQYFWLVVLSYHQELAEEKN